MNRVTGILLINGSYRDHGVTDQAVEIAAETVRELGADVEVVALREYPIEFCLNCRECTQQPGAAPGRCVLDDGMHALVAKIESADALVLASPTNFGSATALYKRFMERLAAYGYWPWKQKYPIFRKAGSRRKRALLISSCAAPGLLGRWLFTTPRQLEMTAKTIGARTVGQLVIGSIAADPRPQLAESMRRKVKALAARLV